jgi:hypothetical protein
MKTEIPDLIEELMAIRSADCIWCRKGLEHPSYSRCAHRKESGRDDGRMAVPRVFVGPGGIAEYWARKCAGSDVAA